MKKLFIVLTCALLSQWSLAQSIVDTCFSSGIPSTDFISTADLFNVVSPQGPNADLLEWTGSAWIGGWPNANLTIPPLSNAIGCRAIFIGSGISWTGGGESFAVRLSAPLVVGQAYSFPITYVSHGFACNGSFAPYVYTNSTASLTAAYSLGNLIPVGYTWTTNSLTFVAAPSQAGHTWIIFDTGLGSTGLVSSFCPSCANPCYTSISLGNDTNLCGGSVVLNAPSNSLSYLWSSGDTTQSIIVNQAGTYWVEVLDNCGNLLSDTIVVSSASAFQVNLGNDTSFNCNSPTSISLSAANSNFNAYSWSTGDTSANIIIYTPGTYWVMATDFCGISSDSINVIIAPPISANMSFTPILCNGANTSLTVTAAGGIGALQYSLNGGTYQNNNVFTVGAGTYTATIQDANGCTTTANTITITNPPAITGSITAGTILCNSGTTTLTTVANGGAGSFQYSLNGGAYQAGNTFTVGAGTYMITIQDANNCTLTTNPLTITEPSAITGSISAGTISCAGNKATLTVTASGGTGSFQYSLNGSTFQNSNIFNVASGTHTVTIKDANGCTFTTNILTITSPTTLSATTSAPLILCHNGTTTLSVTANGGTAPYQYALNGGIAQSNNTFNVNTGNYVVTVQDANGCILATPNLVVRNPVELSVSATIGTLCYQSTTILTAIATGGTGTKLYSLDGSPYQTLRAFTVGSGTYTITVQDANNCTATTSLTATESLPIDIQTIFIDSAYCDGENGQAAVFATGGNGNFTYTWQTNPKQYNDTLQDVATGTYKVIVKDAKGCKQDLSLFIANTPPPIANYISRPDNAYLSIYENDSIQFFPNTTGVYTYSWDFGDGTFSTEQNPTHDFAKSGDYFVTLTVFDEHKACPDIYTLLYHIISTCSTIYAPNAFSPNGDSFNEVFYFIGNVQAFQATIFDRWGREVTRFTSISDTWDGKNMPEGVYTYVLKAVCEDGSTLKRGGTITLTR